MKKIRWMISTAACGSLLALATTASATHSWDGMHWYSATGPVRLPVARSVALKWSTAVNSAIASWQVPVNTTARDVLELVPSTVSVNNSVCNPLSGKILVCSAAYGSTGWLGIASAWTSNGHIVQASTKLNDTCFNGDLQHPGFDLRPWPFADGDDNDDQEHCRGWHWSRRQPGSGWSAR